MDGMHTNRNHKRDRLYLASSVAFLYVYLLGFGVYTLAEIYNYRAKSAVPDLVIEQGSGYKTPFLELRSKAGLFCLTDQMAESQGNLEHCSLEEKLYQ